MSILLPNNPERRPPDSSTAGRPFNTEAREHAPFSLGNRLALCAEWVRPGTRLADIGTDHAYLPIWLASRGLISGAVASDVRPGPLERARENINRYEVQDRISTRLSDGLVEISPEEADDIVMAGMGGELITRIIAGVEWLKDAKKQLILQPMTKENDLRLFLAEQGFAILREQAAAEESHVYTVMLVSYTQSSGMRNTLYPYIGAMDASTPENRKYLARQVRRLEKRAGGLKVTGNERGAEEAFRLAEKIKNLIGEESLR